MDCRRLFSLSEDDVQYLDANHPTWEAIVGSPGRVLLLHQFSIPQGFTVTSASVAILVPASYPIQGLDMAYFYPDIVRTDGARIPQTESKMTIDGKEFQRWSRHYTITKWRPDVDSIATHVMAIKDWLARELERRAVA